ncbi:peptide MFS transporter [Polyangium spumosum]|uniref:MFS transporter n=1 Tax=Polyangium spumosum TaxID=889282 RepID=A0A6N7PKB4_9BACT|nr:peptide MFS transporter [Polyangium spumosum]MRG92247.1 MFS transporter [Polyangium spumosum]
MSTNVVEKPAEPGFQGPKSKKEILGHPAGLFVLFTTEMWERFSYYGMRGLLKLYMVNFLFVTIRQRYQGQAYDATGNPGDVLGWSFIRGLLPQVDPATLGQCVNDKVTALVQGDPTKNIAPMAADVARSVAEQTCAMQPVASTIYGWYTGLVYLTPLFGGFMADRYLGQKRSVYLGGTLMALGQFTLFANENLFFVGLLLLIIGNGFFKPNISTQVGNLYPPGDKRRDGAFTIFYMGINLGAFLTNLVCGTLAQNNGWRYGYLAAGIGMCLGLLIQFFFGTSTLAPDTLKKREEKGEAQAVVKEDNEGQRIGALVLLCALNIVFWAVYEQQGNTMQTWADEKTVWPVIFGFQVPSTWFQSFNPFFIFLFAPFLDRIWAKQAERGTEMSSVTKMAVGCIILGLSFIVMVAGANVIGVGKGSLFWPLVCTMLLTIGELYLSPIGLSLVTKVSPVRFVSMMMGMWFLSSFFGNILSGYIGILYTKWSPTSFFLLLMGLGVAAGLAIAAFNKPLRKAMGNH